MNKGGHYEINTNGAILNKIGDYDTKIDGVEIQFPLKLMNATMVKDGTIVQEFQITFKDIYCEEQVSEGCEKKHMKSCSTEKRNSLFRKRSDCSLQL